MSSILKALKKLENDTSLYKPEQLRIDAKILHDGVSGSYSRTSIFLIAITLFVCGGGATFLYFNISSRHAITPQTISSGTESQSPSPGPSGISPLLKSVKVQATTPEVSTPTISLPVRKQTRLLKDPAQPSLSPRSENQHVEVASPPELKPEAKPVPASTAPVSAVSRPILTINGIAFQEGGSDNLAVINGVTVSNGAIIEGVKVEDIQKDRVRFSQGSEKFEIILNKLNR